MAHRLSVLTLVRDRHAHLAGLLRGLECSRELPFELIVIDMGSASPVVLPPLPFAASVRRLESLSLPLAAARNMAAAGAGGDVLLFLDVDCIPHPELLSHVKELLRNQDAIICPEVRYMRKGETEQVFHANLQHLPGLAHPARSFPDEGVRREHNPGLFWSLAFGVRAGTFGRIGGFDESYVGYGAEDTDFGYRAARAKVPLLFTSGPPAFHQWHPSFDPPLQHFSDIVLNARRFHRIWERWPMEGWLEAFAHMGLIEWSGDEPEIVRFPTPGEIEGARRVSGGEGTIASL
ncbi:MAG: glycosyltransferase [Sphingobium sp.]